MRPVRVGPVIWGAILLLIAGFSFTWAVLGGFDFTSTLWVGLTVGLGALLVLAAIVGVIARAVRPRDATPPAE